MKEEIVVKINDVYAKLKSLEEKADIIEQQLIELENFSEVLKELDKMDGQDILAPVGKNVFMKTKPVDDKFFVDVGSGIFLRKKSDETKEAVSEQIRKLAEMRIELSAESESANEKLRDLVEEYEGEK